MAQISSEQIGWFGQVFGRLTEQVSSVVRGKPEAINLAVICLASEGHLLIEDVPGTGKTTLARALAESTGGSWKRIQFTPDLLPSDVTGAQIFNQVTGSFEFHQGAVFANVVLADEINRASPKTQSALLEVMEERQHTVDGDQYFVPRPFVVVATQNPVELDGTYRLPEAQLDRFMMRISLGYLSHDNELEVLAGHQSTASETRQLEPITSASEIREMIKLASLVHVEPSIQSYIVQLAQGTRDSPDLRLGVSTRGCVALQRSCQALAGSQGRPYVIADDVKQLVREVFTHRMMLIPDAELRGASQASVLDGVLGTISPPAVRTS